VIMLFVALRGRKCIFVKIIYFKINKYGERMRLPLKCFRGHPKKRFFNYRLRDIFLSKW
jgi:hypothetical protein